MLALPRTRMATLAAAATVLTGSLLAVPTAEATTSIVVDSSVQVSTSAAMTIGHGEQEARTVYRYVTKKVCKRSYGRVRCHRVTKRYVVTKPVVAPKKVAPKKALAASASYAFLGTDGAGHPAHFNRCTPVRYLVNPAGAPATFTADLSKALGLLSKASGLTFTYAGSSTVVPYSTTAWASRTPGNGELYIAWATPTRVSSLAGATAGIGGNFYGWSTGQLPRISVAGVTLDATAKLPAGFGTGASTGSLLLHELGHAVNLAHVSDQRQTMYPSLTASTRPAYQAGDLAGLAKLKALPCFAS